jgi:hypothetical protein
MLKLKTLLWSLLAALLLAGSAHAQAPSYITVMRMSGSAAPLGCTTGDFYFNLATSYFTPCGAGNFSPSNFSSPATWTGLQTFNGGIAGTSASLTGAVTLSGAVTAGTLDSILVVDGVQYATCAAAIAAAGSVNNTIIVIPSTYAGVECPTVSTSIQGISESLTSPNITFWNLRGGNTGHQGADWNSNSQDTANHIQTRLSIWNYNTAIASSWTTSAILGTNVLTGAVPSGAVAGITGSVVLTGAVTTGSAQITQAVNCQPAIESTGGTIPFVGGCEGGGGITKSTATTNITTFCSICGDLITNSSSSGATITDAFGGRFAAQTAGTRNNMAVAILGNFMLSDNNCLYNENGGSAAVKDVCFGRDSYQTGGMNLYSNAPYGALIKFLDSAGTHFNWMIGSQQNANNVFEITPSTLTGGTVFTTPQFLVNSPAGGNPAVAVQNSAATGTGLRVTPGGDAVDALTLTNAANSINVFEVDGQGHTQLVETTAPGAGAANRAVCYADSTSHTLKCSYNNGTFFSLPQTVASGTAVMTTAGIGAGACGSTVAVGASGVVATDTISSSHNAVVTAANDGLLILNWWPTSNNVNFNYCNPGTGTVTPTAMTVNWTVVR